MRSAVKLRIFDIPHHQSSHSGVVVRGGGIIFYVAFLLWSLVHGIPTDGSLIGLTILAGVSFADDVHSISPKIRLVCQFAAILLMFYHSGLIQTPLYVIFLLSVACVGVMNIYNFMDGINGMTGGYSLVVALALLYVDMYEVRFTSPSLLVYVILALLVFNLFNFRKHAKCFAGDVGSLSIGFIIVFMVLRLALRGQSMSWMSMLIVYAVDGGMTILHRILLHENLMKPHKKHVYQIMANELKIPHLVVSSIYMGLQAICCIWYIAFPGYLTFFLQIGLLVVTYLLFMKKYYPLHVNNQ
jgi:UDP-N-acetylmuramyl pentapeptide phosphotransferase/UDP-N-acetylglucosamine-1-phosphate transferase